MFWIGLHLPQLALESFSATLAPDAAASPLALEAAHAIVQANAAALALGVRPGQRRATALALAPQLLLGPADPVRDALALRAVAHAALAFTPAVTLDAELPDTVLLEVAGSLRCFGGAAALLARLRQALAPLGHRLQVASAPTALAAGLLARWRDDLALGPHSTDPAALHALLQALPLPLLGRDAAQQSAWLAMGLHTLGDVQHLPRSGLARRFGPPLLLALDRARGDAPDPRDWLELPPQFQQRLELFARADTSDQLLAGARVLLARLVAWAQGQQARIGGFTLLMHHERSSRRAADGVPPFSRLELALAEPSLDVVHLQALLAERLARTPLAAPVLDLGLHCSQLVQAAPPSGELFPTRASLQEGRTRLVERLQARLGRDQVQRLQPVADHRPERATSHWPADAAAPAVPGALAEPPPPWPAHLPLTRPVWLLRQPQPLAEREGMPWWRGQPLALMAGPERIEAGWWDGAPAARDYYVADAGDGALVWVYRLRLPREAAPGGGWFLQGRFG